MEDNKIVTITDTGKSLRESVDELSRALMEVCKNEESNPINLGIMMEEYIEMAEAMNTKAEKKSNGFLEGRKMNKILGKRK